MLKRILASATALLLLMTAMAPVYGANEDGEPQESEAVELTDGEALDGEPQEGETAEPTDEAEEAEPQEMGTVDVAEEEEPEPLSEAMELMNALDIIRGDENGKLHPDDFITRMEFAAVVIRCLGYEEISQTTDMVFPDVAPDSWGRGYVGLAKDLGLIEGYEDGRFGPDDDITLLDAAAILIRAMGYDIEADYQGGYPKGYLVVGNRIGMLKGLSNYEEPALRSQIAELLYNSLEIEFAMGDSHARSGFTILEALNISKIRGALTAVYGSSLGSGGMNLEKGQVMMDGAVYRAGAAIDATYIGLEAYIYIRDYQDRSAATVLYVDPASDRRIVVKAEDVDPSANLNRFRYWADRNMRTVNLPDDAVIVYNGMPLDSSAQRTDERLRPRSGSVTLLDGDGNGSYETVFVKDYDTFVVRSFQGENLYDMYGNNVALDTVNSQITVIKNGSYTDLSAIASGDVLSIASSLDGSMQEIIISNWSLEGTVGLVQNGEDKVRYGLKEEEGTYTMTDRYIEALAKQYSAALKLELGDEVVLYLTAFDEIAYATRSKSGKEDLHYAWLDTMAPSSDNSFGTSYLLRVITEENTYEPIHLDPKRVLFGRSVNNVYTTERVQPEVVAQTLGLNGNTSRQMIQYKLEDDYITELYLADRYQNTDNFSKDLGTGYRNFAYHTLDSEYIYDEDTIVFHVPSTGLYPERISVGPPSEFFSNNNASYNVELWEVDPDTKRVDLIVWTASVTNYNNIYIHYVNSPVMLVTNIISSLDEEGDVLLLEGYEEGELVQRPVSSNLWNQVRSELKPGCVIQYATTGELSGFAKTSEDRVEMVLYNLLFDCNDKTQHPFTLWNYEPIKAVNAKIKVDYGKVKRYDFPMLQTDEAEDFFYEVNGGTHCYRFTAGPDAHFEEIDPSAIGEGDTVFIRKRYNFTKEIIVIE